MRIYASKRERSQVRTSGQGDARGHREKRSNDEILERVHPSSSVDLRILRRALGRDSRRVHRRSSRDTELNTGPVEKCLKHRRSVSRCQRNELGSASSPWPDLDSSSAPRSWTDRQAAGRSIRGRDRGAQADWAVGLSYRCDGFAVCLFSFCIIFIIFRIFINSTLTTLWILSQDST